MTTLRRSRLLLFRPPPAASDLAACGDHEAAEAAEDTAKDT